MPNQGDQNLEAIPAQTTTENGDEDVENQLLPELTTNSIVSEGDEESFRGLVKKTTTTRVADGVLLKAQMEATSFRMQALFAIQDRKVLGKKRRFHPSSVVFLIL